MTTNEKGNIGLVKAIEDLTIKGFQVFLPMTDTTLIDLIISDKQFKLKKIQVKYIKLNDRGSIAIQRDTVVNGKRVLNDFSNLDYFAIYCPDNNKMYYIPTSIITNKSISLKVTEPKRNFGNLVYASEFTEIK